MRMNQKMVFGLNQVIIFGKIGIPFIKPVIKMEEIRQMKNFFSSIIDRRWEI
ncbi:unnamed protein product [Paramecium sonneborni]|uniref:Uncharacterized protein n=1 Tax=Paramecium sonneborni TaxID=65129 RepID=A0A8S1RT65_9CILI|nr:unnamed protein product [Paramecium sonneborni]